MKNLIFTAILFVFSTLYLFAQDINENVMSMNQGSQPGYHMTFSNLKKSKVEKIWSNFIKSHDSKLKKVKKAKEKMARDISIAGLPGQTNLYSAFTKKGKDTDLSIWIENEGVYVNSSTDQALSDHIYVFLEKFLMNTDMEAQKLVVEEEEKNLKGLEKDLKNLTKKKERMEKKILDYEEKIAKLKQDIENNINDQAKKRTEINTQKEKITAEEAELSRLKDN